jgi:sugar phosphate isomerase/epimerase
VRIGISTACFFPMLTEQALERTLALGCEVAEVFINSPSEVSPAFARHIKAQADGANAGIVSMHPCSSEYEGASFFGRYPRRFNDALDTYKRIFEMCATAGAGFLAFHGARTYYNIEQAVYFERFDRIAKAAGAFGVVLCQENVSRFFSGGVGFISEMRRQLPDAKFLLDIKQAVRAGIDPFEMLDAMGDALVHIHASDHNAQRDCMAPGCGSFDFEKLARRLFENGYAGDIIVELYRRDFKDEDQLAQSKRVLENIFQKRLK